MAPKAGESNIHEALSLLKLGYSLRSVTKIMRERGIKISKSTVSYWKNKILSDKENVIPVNTSNRKRGPEPAITPQQLSAIKKALLGENPPSQRFLASKYNVHRRSIYRYIKKLDLTCRKKPKVHALDEKSIQKRHERSLWLARFLARNLRNIITSDEKLFHISDFNTGSKYFYRKSTDKHRVVSRLRHKRFGKSLMVWAAISWLGRSKLYFVKPCIKINARYYVDSILKPFLTDEARDMALNSFIFHQDSAPSHTSKTAQEYLKNMGINYIFPHRWTPNSPDNAPMDFFAWGYLLEKIKKVKVNSIFGIKRALNRAWKEIPQELIQKALKDWPKRCLAIYKNGGSQIEHQK